jgi:hypothetical protein
MLAYIYTLNGISLLLNGVTTTIARDDPRYDNVTAALREGRHSSESQEDFEAYVTILAAPPKQQVINQINAQELSDRITVVGDTVYYNSVAINNSLTRRMLEFIRENIEIRHLVPFLENLMQNPSNRTVEHLYAFLEYGKIPLTGDGHFLAYKAVRSDWKDIHSGTFDNSIGKVCEVFRNQVDENPDQTCSHGLHVCSFEYLPHFAHADGHVVIVKVNPKDVVAIPRDYNNTKMRVCRYEVVNEVDGYYAERRDYLSEKPLFDEWDRYPEDPEPVELAHEVFDLPIRVSTYSDDGTAFGSAQFDDWDEAEEYASGCLDIVTPTAVITDGRRTITLQHPL